MREEYAIPKGSKLRTKDVDANMFLIEIPPRGPRMDSIFLAIWVVGWTATLAFALLQFARTRHILFLMWFLGGMLFELTALYVLLWPMFCTVRSARVTPLQ